MSSRRVRSRSRPATATGAAAAIGVVILLATLLPSGAGTGPGTTVAAPAPGNADERAAALVAQLTLAEKTLLMAGTFVGADGAVAIPGVSRLCIPPIPVVDGPAGIRVAGGGTTQLPAPLALAAGFDPALAARYGDVLGNEAAATGHRMLFAPVVNLPRDPRAGRAAESFGEDPLLTSRLAAEEVRAVQRHPVIAVPKHYLANDQERFRFVLAQVVDERTLREIYLPAFEAVLRDGGARGLMAAYPSVNGSPNTASVELLRGIVKDEWGWPGVVVSDFGATTDTVGSTLAGLDVEFPVAVAYGEALRAAVDAGSVPVASVDEAVHRLLRAEIEAGLLDGPVEETRDAERNTATARDVAVAGTVLLRNEGGVLPLPPGLRSVAVLGPAADDIPTVLGSGQVAASDPVTPVAGLRAALPGATVTTDPVIDVAALPAVPFADLTGRYHTDPGLLGEPTVTRADAAVDADFGYAPPAPGIPARSPGGDPTAGAFSVRWTGRVVAPETGDYELGTTGAGAIRVSVDGAPVVDGGAPGDVDFHHPHPQSAPITLRAGQSYAVEVTYTSPFIIPGSVRLWWLTPSDLRERIGRAVRLAGSAEQTVLVVRDWSGEGFDRANLRLPAGQQQLVREVTTARPGTVVVLQTGGPVDVRGWLDAAPAVLETWYPGEQSGAALAEVLLGRDPGGRLPVTFPRSLADAPTATPAGYPTDEPFVAYDEGLRVGYRWYDERPDAVAYPFGFGLSYSTAAYTDLRVGHDEVTFRVADTGSRTGVVVPQVYLRLPDRSEPLRLAGFERLELPPGGTAEVRIALPERAFQVWDAGSDSWTTPAGPVEVTVRTDARQVVLTGQIRS